MTDFSADKLRALDAGARDALTQYMALGSPDPAMSEDAQLRHAFLSGYCESRRQSDASILAMAEERERSEKHRNDLADRITDQSITIGALKADNARIRETGMQLAFAAGALNIATDGMADMDEARRIVLDRLKDWKSALGEEPKP
ncbi:hypothetical protein LH128_05293 [Sphingomonas sp. LH128]|uniref:hypothetical protein n=1 Tax=Sphingomonas sp. LH128 TaxID=473781 RepID=UPI00027C9B2E|nr:hypothetical protein [Sphingomonas sp. LH128]EJU14147.1 hypothetical protein LH128_05293 [Sphingomonas sp. LH128]